MQSQLDATLDREQKQAAAAAQHLAEIEALHARVRTLEHEAEASNLALRSAQAEAAAARQEAISAAEEASSMRDAVTILRAKMADKTEENKGLRAVRLRCILLDLFCTF